MDGKIVNQRGLGRKRTSWQKKWMECYSITSAEILRTAVNKTNMHYDCHHDSQRLSSVTALEQEELVKDSCGHSGSSKISQIFHEQ